MIFLKLTKSRKSEELTFWRKLEFSFGQEKEEKENGK